MKCRNINLIDQITSIFGENFLENDKRNYLKKALETQDEIDILNKQVLKFILQASFYKKKTIIHAIRKINLDGRADLDFNIMKEAFPKRKDLIKFIQHGVNYFYLDTKESIPWEDYPELHFSHFNHLPTNVKTKESYLSWIDRKKLTMLSYDAVPTSMLRSICKDDKNFCEYIFSRFINENSDAKRYWILKLYEDNLLKDFWNGESILSHYIDNLYSIHNSELIPGFNTYPEDFKKSFEIRKNLIRPFYSLFTNTYYVGNDDEGYKDEIKGHWIGREHSDFLTFIDREFIQKLHQLDNEFHFGGDYIRLLSLIIATLEYYELTNISPMQLAFIKREIERIIIKFPTFPPKETTLQKLEQLDNETHFDDIPF